MAWNGDGGIGMWERENGNGTNGLESLVEIVEEVDSERLECLALKSGGNIREKESFCQEAIAERRPLRG